MDYFLKFLQSKILFFCVVLLFVAKIALLGVFINLPVNIFFADITKNTLVDFLNQGRADFGLQPLTENQKLDQAAILKAQDMVKKGYFAHQSPDGITPWHWFSQSGYDYKYAGENLSVGFIDSKELYNAWYNSASHRKNMLNPNYKEVGTAILSGFGKNNAILVVQFFGAQKPQSAETPATKQSPAAAGEVELPAGSSTSGAESAASNASVLSQAAEAKPGPGPGRNTIYLYNYENILQEIIYGFIAVVGAVFLLNMFVDFKAQKKELIFRALALLAILLLAALTNKDIIVFMIPHKIMI